jgi:hypothetical protein
MTNMIIVASSVMMAKYKEINDVKERGAGSE